MKHLKKFESFDKVNEEFLGDLFRAATGALKGFLSGLMQPFKSLKDDFKKGLKFEEVKTKINKALDEILKSSTDGINKAKDEAEINQMTDAFLKELEGKMV